jgi:hypothetical protein
MFVLIRYLHILKSFHTEQIGAAVSDLQFKTDTIQTSPMLPDIMTEVSCGFPQSPLEC